MPNPIIIIFSYNQVCAGETFFQDNFPGLHQNGYNTYLDEDQAGISLDLKRSAINQILEEVKDIAEDSPGFWQKAVNTAKKNTIRLLISHRINYVAYDLPEEVAKALIMRNLNVIQAHPKGMAQGLADLYAGKIPGREAVGHFRDQLLDVAFAKHALNATNGVFCITGVYNAKHMQTFFRNKYPQQDILSYFAYEGAPFEDFEVIARDPQRNSTVFPHGARLMDMENDAEQAKSAIVNDLELYKNMLAKLKSLELSFKQQTLSQDQLKGIQKELQAIKTMFQQLKALNNADIYLCTIDIYLLKCAVELMDVDYFKTNYLPAKLKLDSLPKSESKDELMLVIKEIVPKYRAATQIAATPSIASTNMSIYSGLAPIAQPADDKPALQLQNS